MYEDNESFHFISISQGDMKVSDYTNRIIIINVIDECSSISVQMHNACEIKRMV